MEKAGGFVVGVIYALIIFGIGFAIWMSVANAGSKVSDKVIYGNKDPKEIPQEERKELQKKSEKSFGVFVIIGLVVTSFVMYLISDSIGIPIA